MNKSILVLLFISVSLLADAVYNKNKKANRLYEQGKYEEALSVYEDALLESPEEKKLSMNKGSALYRLEDYDGAEESYNNALSIENNKARADLYYNMGNIRNMQGDRLMQMGDQQAMEKYKTARDNYIKSLDLKPHDRDAKWNLQITQEKIKQLEQQQKNKDNQDQQNKDQQNKQDQKKDQQQNKNDKQDQQKQQKEQQDKEQEKDKNKQQQNNREDQDKEKQKPKPQPRKSEEDMKKEEALRLLRQYADDDKELNKPNKKMKVLTGKKPEKDW